MEINKNHAAVALGVLLLMIVGFFTFGNNPPGPGDNSTNSYEKYSRFKYTISNVQWERIDINLNPDAYSSDSILIPQVYGDIKSVQFINNGGTTENMTLYDQGGTIIASALVTDGGGTYTVTQGNQTILGGLNMTTTVQNMTYTDSNTTVLNTAIGTRSITLTKNSSRLTPGLHVSVSTVYSSYAGESVSVTINGNLLGSLSQTGSDSWTSLNSSILSQANNITFANGGHSVAQTDTNATGLVGANGTVGITATHTPKATGSTANVSVSYDYETDDNVSVSINGHTLGNLAGSGTDTWTSVNQAWLSGTNNVTLINDGTGTNVTSVGLDYLWTAYSTNMTNESISYQYVDAGIPKSNTIVIIKS